MEDKILKFMGITQKDFDIAKNYVEEYEEVEKALDKFTGLYGLKDIDLLKTVEAMECILIDNGAEDYQKYKKILDEYENFDESNYFDNEGIYEELVRERLGGLA